MKAIEKTTHTLLPEISSSLRSDWEQLARSVDANYSLYPDWTSVTATSHDMSDHTIVISAYDGHQLVGIFPTTMCPRRALGIPMRSLELIGNVVSYHNGLVTSLDPRAALDMLVREAECLGADVVHLAGIPDNSRIGAYLENNDQRRAFVKHSVSGESSPYLSLEKDWNELLASKPKKFRYKTRKRAESMENHDRLQMRWFDKEEDCLTLLTIIREIEESSWKKEAGVSIFERDHERRYHELLLPFLSSKNALFSNVLFHDETPIAYNLCCVWDGWVGQMKTSFDTRFAELSPGSLVIDYAIRHSIEIGATEFDFLGDTDPHKLAWTKSVRQHSDHFLYLRASLKGRVVGSLNKLRNRFTN
jgi:CelD/BcsL family acetyltransferase involved in cellulose biosynthesis